MAAIRIPIRELHVPAEGLEQNSVLEKIIRHLRHLINLFADL